MKMIGISELGQVVAPAELRRVLKANGDTLSRPKDFGPDDEWFVKDPAAVSLGKRGGAVKSAAKAKSSAANGAKGGRPRGVVTWQAPNGETIDICKHCEAALFGNWPRNSRGEEYCSVSHGLHSGTCQVCNPTE